MRGREISQRDGGGREKGGGRGVIFGLSQRKHTEPPGSVSWSSDHYKKRS